MTSTYFIFAENPIDTTLDDFKRLLSVQVLGMILSYLFALIHAPTVYRRQVEPPVTSQLESGKLPTV